MNIIELAYEHPSATVVFFAAALILPTWCICVILETYRGK